MSSMKYDIPQLKHDTRFGPWQIKMKAILTQAEVDGLLINLVTRILNLGPMRRREKIVRP